MKTSQVFPRSPVLVAFILQLIFVEKHLGARFIPGVICLDFNSVAGRVILARALISGTGDMYSCSPSLPRVWYTRGKQAGVYQYFVNLIITTDAALNLFDFAIELLNPTRRIFLFSPAPALGNKPHSFLKC